MELYKDQLKELRVRALDPRPFIPSISVSSLMTREWVTNALRQSGTRFYHMDATIDIIIARAWKIFGLLILVDQVSLISRFIEKDVFQDDKLPFRASFLATDILPGAVDEHRVRLCADELCEKQWEFLVPVFSVSILHRKFEDQVILPFTKNELIAKGHFGHVYKVAIHPECRGQDVEFHKEVVRKEMTETTDHRTELENLSILRCLKHPNILEVLASYTYQQKHNLLFRFAEHGNMKELLLCPRESTPFRTNEEFFVALADLSSGLAHLHDFYDEKYATQLIGYHQDLSPRNILVSQKQFILADFGLSKFKDSSETSSTSFQKGQGDYQAPECEDIKAGFQKLHVRRSSDMWSFGCILAEMATYMSLGPDGVRNFREAREFTLGRHTWTLFHCGIDTENVEVIKWLEMLDGKASDSMKLLITLVKNMLAIKGEDRANARQATAQLCFIALHEISSSIADLLDLTLKRSDNFDAMLQHARFEGWRYAMDMSPKNKYLERITYNYDWDFHRIEKTLYKLRSHIETLSKQTEFEGPRMVFSGTCLINDQLDCCLSQGRLEQSQIYTRALLMESSPSIVPYLNTNNAQASTYKDIRMLLNLKQMAKLTESYQVASPRRRYLDPAIIKIGQQFGDHNLGEVAQNGVQHSVLIEWRKHQSNVADELINVEIFTRVERLAELFGTEKPDEFRALHCRGFFHDPAHLGFGLVFDYPQDNLNPTSLHELMEESRGIQDHPNLEDKFELAYTIAKAVLNFHVVGWLHKRLSPLNVIFFSATDEPSVNAVGRPYIAGFNHSRPDEPFTYTDFPESPSNDYYHPKYLQEQRGYRPEYDYYSLGLILYEIGLWKSIRSLTKSLPNPTLEERHDKILQDRLPLLKKTMGNVYYEAVKACLTSDWSTGDGRTVQLAFERLVVGRLQIFHGLFAGSS